MTASAVTSVLIIMTFLYVNFLPDDPFSSCVVSTHWRWIGSPSLTARFLEGSNVDSSNELREGSRDMERRFCWPLRKGFDQSKLANALTEFARSTLKLSIDEIGRLPLLVT